MLIPSLGLGLHRFVPSLSRGMNANSQLETMQVEQQSKSIKRDEC